MVSPSSYRRSLAARRATARGTGGFILPVILIAGLVASVGAATLASRALSLRLGKGLQDQAREARDAADSGFEAVIAELNRGENRQLAGSGVAPSGWTTTDAALRNPCLSNGSVAPSAEALQLAAGNWRTVENNPNLRYRIRPEDLRVRNFDRSARGTNRDFEILPREQQLNRLTLTIEGQSLRNGAVVATTVVSQELGLAPKCCGVSLGEDPPAAPNIPNKLLEICPSAFPRLLVGLNGGGVTRAGSGAQLREQVAGSNNTGTSRPAQLLCLVKSSGPCGGSANIQSVDTVPIRTIQLTPPPLPSFPARDNRTGLATGTNGFIIVSNDANDNSATVSSTATQSRAYQDYLRVNSAGVVQLCNATRNNNTASGPTGLGANPAPPVAFVSGSCDSRINSYCARTGDSPANYSYHCRIARLRVSDMVTISSCTASATLDTCEWQRIQNNTFFVDSSRGRIFLHFNSPWVIPDACGDPSDGRTLEVVCTQNGYNDGQIQHLYCATPSDAAPCNTRALPDTSPRATIYSDTNINIKIGDDGFIRDMFVYAPKGTLTLAEDPLRANNAYGLPNFRGSAWVDNISMGLGINDAFTTQISLPPNSSAFQGLGTATADNPFRLLPFFEWIVRGSTCRSGFGRTCVAS